MMILGMILMIMMMNMLSAGGGSIEEEAEQKRPRQPSKNPSSATRDILSRNTNLTAAHLLRGCIHHATLFTLVIVISIKLRIFVVVLCEISAQCRYLYEHLCTEVLTLT